MKKILITIIAMMMLTITLASAETLETLRVESGGTEPQGYDFETMTINQPWMTSDDFYFDGNNLVEPDGNPLFYNINGPFTYIGPESLPTNCYIEDYIVNIPPDATDILDINTFNEGTFCYYDEDSMTSYAIGLLFYDNGYPSIDFEYEIATQTNTAPEFETFLVDDITTYNPGETIIFQADEVIKLGVEYIDSEGDATVNFEIVGELSSYPLDGPNYAYLNGADWTPGQTYELIATLDDGEFNVANTIYFQVEANPTCDISLTTTPCDYSGAYTWTDYNSKSIEFTNIEGTIEETDISSGADWVYVETGSALDVPATIWFNDVNDESLVPYRNGEECPPSICTNINNNGIDLSFDVTGFSNYSFGINHTYCYQETADAPNGADGSCDLEYTGNYVDGNLLPTKRATIYINYTKPATALNTSIWTTKTRNAAGTYLENYTIPQDCFEQQPLQLGFGRLYTISSGHGGMCYDGTQWVEIFNKGTTNPGGSNLLGTNTIWDGDWNTGLAAVGNGNWYTSFFGTTYAAFYEEAMIWDIGPDPCDDEDGGTICYCRPALDKFEFGECQIDGTLTLQAGALTQNGTIIIDENDVLEGNGANIELILGGVNFAEVTGSNAIIRDFTLNASGVTAGNVGGMINMNYGVSNTLIEDITIYGGTSVYQPALTYLKSNHGTTIRRVHVESPRFIIFSNNGGNDVTIRDSYFELTTSSPTYTIQLDDMNNLLLENNTVIRTTTNNYIITTYGITGNFNNNNIYGGSNAIVFNSNENLNLSNNYLEKGTRGGSDNANFNYIGNTIGNEIEMTGGNYYLSGNSYLPGTTLYLTTYQDESLEVTYEEVKDVNWNVNIGATGSVLINLPEGSVFYDENFAISQVTTLSNIMKAGTNWLWVNTTSVFDNPATITFNNVGSSIYRPIKDGERCLDCSNVVNDGNTLIFDVTGFSNYTYDDPENYNHAPNITYKSPTTPLSLQDREPVEQIFSISAEDYENDTLTYTWKVNGMTQPETTQLFDALFEIEGSYNITVIVSDGYDQETETWDVYFDLLGYHPDYDVNDIGPIIIDAGAKSTVSAGRLVALFMLFAIIMLSLVFVPRVLRKK